jgi:cytochrome P450
VDGSGGSMSRSVPGASHRTVLRSRLFRSFALSLNFRRRVRVRNWSQANDLTVPYHEPGTALGLNGFVLGLDGQEHEAEASRIATVLASAIAGHQRGLAIMRDWTASQKIAGREVDLKEFAEQAVTRWASSFLGVSDEARPLLVTAAAEVVARTYTNPTFPGCKFDEGKAAASKKQVDELRVAIERQNGVPGGSVLHYLQLSRPGQATADVVGLSGGPIELVVECALVIVDWALKDPVNWSTLHSCAVQSELALTAELEPILSMFPPTAMVPRLDAKQKPVMVTLWDPRRGSARRVAPDLNPVFGFEPHVCLGKAHALEALGALLHDVFLHSMGTYVDDASWKLRLDGRMSAPVN